MIETIKVCNIASFGEEPEELNGLKEINVVYGSNGTGKTTITRLLDSTIEEIDDSISWNSGTPMEILVYNRDFIERNFGEAEDLRGVFTLGEKDTETVETIKNLRKEVERQSRHVRRLTTTLEDETSEGFAGIRQQLRELEQKFMETCWKLKQRFDGRFSEAFSGSRGSKELFKQKLLLESINNKAESITLSDLEEKSKTVYGNDPQLQDELTYHSTDKIIELENLPILSKIIVGKKDVDIAKLITELGNSDWVRQGIQYYDSERRICPFCQQTTDKSLEESLNTFFDNAFQTDTDSIQELLIQYKNESHSVTQSIVSILEKHNEFVEKDQLQASLDLIRARTKRNIGIIESKQKEPSKVVELDSLSGLMESVTSQISKSNDKISKHNSIVENLKSEKLKLNAQVWSYLLDKEIMSELNSYNQKKSDFEKAINSLQQQIKQQNQEISEKVEEIKTLERETTSILPTVDGINDYLRSFGFIGFKIANSSREPYYKIVRPDGSDAKETLSEGEKNFVTFLYFYHLIHGSMEASGATSDRIVVIDDPVSSLDSDVLFVVSSMVKRVFNEVRNESGPIKQVIVLTHNVQLHKNISYNHVRSGDDLLRDETFWTIKKNGLRSVIEGHDKVPVKTIYELLWMDVRDADSTSPSLPNTLRRILEYYFKILGRVDFENISDRFSGQDKVICDSLFSWVNEGSHAVHDDLFYFQDESQIRQYLSVFESIFNETEHKAHYNMMMGLDSD